MSTDTDKVIVMIEREMLSNVLLAKTLIKYASDNRDDLPRVLSAVKKTHYNVIWDILTFYPFTDIGWSLLPLSRKPHLNTNLSHREQGDIAHIPYQEDRPNVEYLRDLLRPGTGRASST